MYEPCTPAQYLAPVPNTRRGDVRWPEEVALNYPPLLVLERCKEKERERQLDGAQASKLPYFDVEIVPDNWGTRQKQMKLTGELFDGDFRDPDAITRFLIAKGFTPESIDLSKGEVLYATHPKEHLPFMHWIVRLLVHFQATGEWLNVAYWYADYPDQ
ncbi:hypothetical protein [Shewanella sp.]|uniref:hypothetical protein n=1 Tax=Shewanella sp. TaxID=50422 RepID=UPI003568EE60